MVPNNNTTEISDFNNLEYYQGCNNTTILLYLLPNEWDDATWILTSAFVIFTMQSGFGLLESGTATLKNEVNIMVKNAVDVIYGGFTYWMFGYAFSFGDDPGSNAFSGFGGFFYHANDTDMGKYSQFVFHASFATTATTIVSGAMVERTRLEAYIAFSFMNTLVFSFPAHWVWAHNGFLNALGVLDIAGAGPVHIAGGVTGLTATVFLRPRHRRYSSKTAPPMGSPTNAVLGMFMLWWGWLGFNCGSTNGITEDKWKLAARSAVSTICSSMAGGITGITLSYITKRRKFDVGYIINGVLGSLVSITAICAAAHPWESLVVGLIGGFIACGGIELMNKLQIDDPVGVIPVHAMCGVWSLIAGGIFGRQITQGRTPDGLTTTGNFHLLGVQLLAVLCITSWCALSATLLLSIIHLTIGLRLSLDQEMLGADLVEHSIGSIKYDKIRKCIVNEHILSDVEEVSGDLEADSTSRAKRAWLNAFQKVTTIQRYAKSKETKPGRAEQVWVNFYHKKRQTTQLNSAKRKEKKMQITSINETPSQPNGNVATRRRIKNVLSANHCNSLTNMRTINEKRQESRKFLNNEAFALNQTDRSEVNTAFVNGDSDEISRVHSAEPCVVVVRQPSTVETCLCNCHCVKTSQSLQNKNLYYSRLTQAEIQTISIGVQTVDNAKLEVDKIVTHEKESVEERGTYNDGFNMDDETTNL
ncbi:putative ammonium transporter 2 [Glandiceps talaboti]